MWPRWQVDAKRGLGVAANRKILLVPVVEHRSLIHNRFSPYLFYARICLDTGATSQLRMIYAEQEGTRGHANKENGLLYYSALITDISRYTPSSHSCQPRVHTKSHRGSNPTLCYKTPLTVIVLILRVPSFLYYAKYIVLSNAPTTSLISTPFPIQWVPGYCLPAFSIRVLKMTINFYLVFQNACSSTFTSPHVIMVCSLSKQITVTLVRILGYQVYWGNTKVMTGFGPSIKHVASRLRSTSSSQV